MTNTLVGEVYLKVIESTVEKSSTAFEEYGVSGGTLNELQAVSFDALIGIETSKVFQNAIILLATSPSIFTSIFLQQKPSRYPHMAACPAEKIAGSHSERKRGGDRKSAGCRSLLAVPAG